MKNNIVCVSGIDTDAGKSYATGYIAKQWLNEGKHIITQKLIQTGNVERSEDIELHRKIMGLPLLEEDISGLTMPQIFSYPASPHLAARIDGKNIDFEKIDEATKLLSEKYDTVLLEGAGGLMVPLTEDYLTIDYIAERNYPILFVTSGKLGSINHTLLSLEAIKKRGLTLHTVAYNLFPTVSDTTIQQDTMQFIKNYLAKHFPETDFVVVPELT